MKLEIKCKLNPSQQELINDMTTKYLHLSGGYGSGKTTGLTHKLFKLSWKNRDINGGLVCPSYADFKRDVKLSIEQECDLNKIKFFYHNSEHWYQFPWSQGKIFVATAEKPLKGPNWGFALINELTLIPFERYRETIARVRVKRARYPQIASCGTPEGLLTGYYKFFIEEPDASSKVLYASTDENLHNLSGDYIKSLQSAYDQRQLEAYRHGKFINSIGNRFYYSYDPEKNNDVNTKEDLNFPVMVSMDFNVDPMVANVWQWQNSGALASVGEIILRENADTNKMAQALIARGYTPDRTEIYPDPAGQSRSTKGQPDVVILKNHGFYNIKVRPAAPPFRKRQLNVCNLFEKQKIVINPKSCPWLHRDLLLCTQDQVSLIKDKSSPELTHNSDAMDYLMDIVFEFSGRKPQSGQFRIR